MRRCILVILLLTVLCAPVFAADAAVSSDAVIQSMESEYTIAQDGACTVLSTIELKLSGAQEFVLSVPAAARGLLVSSGVYTSSHEGDMTLLHFRTEGLTAEQTLQISYSIPETVLATETEQTCTLPLLTGACTCPIRRFNAVITFPAEFEQRPSFESGYYGDLIENYLDIGISDGVVTLHSIQPMRDHESLSMKLSLPEGYFDLRFLAGKTAGVDRILFWVFLAAGLVYWVIFLRNRFLLPKAEVMPPLAGNAGAVPYLLTADTPDLALMVMQWASLGYLSLTRLRSGKILLQKQMDMGNERKNYEIQIFRDLFARSETLYAPCDDYRMVRSRVPAATGAYWEIRLFAVKAGRPAILRILGAACGAALHLLVYDRIIPAQGWRWFVIVPLVLLGALSCWLLQPASTCFLRRRPGKTLAPALAALVYLLVSYSLGSVGFPAFVCVLFQLLIGLMLALGGRRTKRGLRQAAQLFGLRRYLLFSKPETLAEPLAEDPQYFYRTLPYAEALRVGGRFTGKFAGRTLEPCAWLRSERSTPDSAGAFRSLFCVVLDTLREQTDAPVLNLIRNIGAGKKRRRRTPHRAGN